MMTPDLSPDLVLSIDVKKNRLRVHRSTLKALGDPPYLQLLFSPRRAEIAVLKRDRQLPGGQEIRVVMNHRRLAGSCEIYSKELIGRIRQSFSGLDQEGLYRLSGFAVPEEEGVCFPLSSLVRQVVPRG